MDPVTMARRLGEGLLSFPVTPFADDGAVNIPAFQDHCDWMLRHDLSGLFAAGGTGEFFSLTPEEVVDVVRAAVDVRKAGVPVISGCGYGTAIATGIAGGAAAGIGAFAGTAWGTTASPFRQRRIARNSRNLERAARRGGSIEAA